ncbi:MAG: MBL fold metallo-hydrolase [Vicinamibacterales bacterium]
MAVRYIDDDFVTVRAEPAARARVKVTLAFGDPVEILETSAGFTRVRVLSYFDGPFEGFVKGVPPTRDTGVLSFSLVDVQQGDGMVLETPAGKVMFIDGGDNKLFARHVAARFLHRRSTAEAPLEVEALVVTHGDGDHFDGLNDIVRSETLGTAERRKRIFIHPKRVYHNGLLKAPTRDAAGKTIPDVRQFGRTVTADGRPYVVDLYDDTRTAPAEAANVYFERWHQSLTHWEARGPILCRRLAHGMDGTALFDFLQEEGITVEVQGPFTTLVDDPATGHAVPGLPFLPAPDPSAVMHLEHDDHHGAPSASHTINGHSVALRLTYGHVRIALTGDLNRDAMQAMFERLPMAAFESEIVKAPHHGSADFDFATLRAMRPVVAVVSSGDENATKEYIHPRATLMSALGHVMRGDTGVIFSTELAAFFSTRDEAYTVADLKRFFTDRKDESFTGADVAKLIGKGAADGGPGGRFFAFERTNFGIVHLRTDGERVLVFTHSGKAGLNEGYRFTVSASHEVTFARTLQTR